MYQALIELGALRHGSNILQDAEDSDRRWRDGELNGLNGKQMEIVVALFFEIHDVQLETNNAN